MTNNPLIITKCFTCSTFIRHDFTVSVIFDVPPQETDILLATLKQVIAQAQEPDETMRKIKGMMEHAPSRKITVQVCRTCHDSLFTSKTGLTYGLYTVISKRQQGRKGEKA